MTLLCSVLLSTYQMWCSTSVVRQTRMSFSKTLYGFGEWLAVRRLRTAAGDESRLIGQDCTMHSRNMYGGDSPCSPSKVKIRHSFYVFVVAMATGPVGHEEPVPVLLWNLYIPHIRWTTAFITTAPACILHKKIQVHHDTEISGCGAWFDNGRPIYHTI